MPTSALLLWEINLTLLTCVKIQSNCDSYTNVGDHMFNRLLVVSVFVAFTFGCNETNNKTGTPPNSNNSNVASLDSNEPPLKLKSIGINFEDFKFTQEKLQFDRLIMGYGFVVPANSASNGKDKSNPQPTFVVPLGTKVRSLVDGIVVAIPTLWSGDKSIQVTADGQMQKWIYETEHVINPIVKVGDRVTAGQVIAEVGSFGGGDPDGFGAVEIGILAGGNPPYHVCPFAHLDESIKQDTFDKLRAHFNSWQDYVGIQTLFPETTIPGCLTLDPIEG